MSGLKTTTTSLFDMAESSVTTARSLDDLRDAATLAAGALASKAMTEAQVATFQTQLLARCQALGLRVEDILDETPPTLRGAS